MYPEHLIALLNAALEPIGFWRFPHMNYFVRTRGALRDVIGWYQGDTSEHYAVYFGVWVPELEPDLQGVKIDESVDIRNISLMHDLSLKKEHGFSPWWNEKQGDQADSQAYLIKLINQIALPYFDTFACIGDVAEMVFYDNRFHNTELEGRLLDNAFSSFFNYDLESAPDQLLNELKALQRTTPAFEYANGYFWRRLGEDIFHIVLPRFFAAWRFAEIRVIVWHPLIDGITTVPNAPPEHFSQVAWRSICSSFPAFLGESNMPHTTVENLIEGLRSQGLPWLEKISCVQDVYNAIRPEFKKFYPDY